MKTNYKNILITISTFIILILTGCNNFMNRVSNQPHLVLTPKNNKESISLIFSHNINGEIASCGCRHFPLGGLPQVAGTIEKFKSSGMIYIDTGDMFFPSTIIPQTLIKSQIFNATKLAKAQSLMGLNIFIPGDQDFSAGVDFLTDTIEKEKFNSLISNLNKNAPNSSKFKSNKQWIKVNVGKTKIFLLGIVNPDVISDKYKALFLSPIKSIRDGIKMISVEDVFDSKNPYHRLIILSHSGIDADKIIAKKFPRIDWIIGAHSQSFFKFSVDIGNTKIVQVLARNHYLGEINIKIKQDRFKDTYQLLEARIGNEKNLNPNPFIKLIKDHKGQMNKIQLDEQNEFLSALNQNTTPQLLKQSYSCLECHEDIYNQWSGTRHALAFLTLFKGNTDKNKECIGCHSLGFKENNGFMKINNIIQSKNSNKKEYYLKHVKKLAKKFPSKMSKKERINITKKWNKLDHRYKIEHNFFNVQCLNCHIINPDHPFTVTNNSEPLKKTDLIKKYQNICLKCHTPSRSPEWYKEGRPDQELLYKHLKNPHL